MMSDDPRYTIAIRNLAKRNRYEIRYASENEGVAIFFDDGTLAATFTTVAEGASWMEKRLGDFRREWEVAEVAA